MYGNSHILHAVTLSGMTALNADRVCLLADSVKIGNLTPVSLSSIPRGDIAVMFILGGIVGGLFPDIDNPTSHTGRLTSPVSNWLGKLSDYMGTERYHHRGLLHDPFIYITGLILSFFFLPALMGFFIGGISHTLMLDAFNPLGVPWFFGKRRLKLGNIPAGSKKARALTWFQVVFFLLAGAILFLQNYTIKF